MYKKYFGFQTEPFAITPDSELFYCSEQIEEVINVIEYQLNKRRGFLLLTGDVGTGKTILCRTLLNKLVDFNTTLILNPFLNEKEILYYICKDFGIIKDNSNINKGGLFHLLTKFLVTSYKKGKNSLIIVDEAQNLSFEAFEMIRQISNIELEDTKLVQIIFAGQPELIDKINLKEYRQLRQRISTVIELGPLTLDDTVNYINFRIQETLHYKRFLFTNAALKLIYKYTNGIPRDINQLAEISLITAFANNHKTVTRRDVKIAAKEYYKKFVKKKPKITLISLIVIFLIILIILLLEKLNIS
jgi:general secretion pathway protein A